jgi:glycosyltransferase involved in cell wall biosynthesis
VAVPPDDVESFVGALRRLVDDPAERVAMGVRGRQWVEREASPAAVGDAYDELVRGGAAAGPDDPSR